MSKESMQRDIETLKRQTAQEKTQSESIVGFRNIAIFVGVAVTLFIVMSLMDASCISMVILTGGLLSLCAAALVREKNSKRNP